MMHVEFVVLGPPVSYQTSDRANLRAWQSTVKTEAGKVWSRPPLTGKLKLLLINFHEGDTPPMDDDNMVKPIPKLSQISGLLKQRDLPSFSRFSPFRGVRAQQRSWG